MNKVSLWQLFKSFFLIGLMTFGGGYALIGVMQDDLVERKKWLTSAEMLDMIVIAESTPGVIAVNTATSVGFRLRGFWGAIFATLGVVLPSFLIICALSFAINALKDNRWYTAAFTGVQACVLVLVLNAFIKMAGQLERDVFNVIVALCAFFVATFTNFDVIWLILCGFALGIVYGLITKRGAKKSDLPLAKEGDEK